MNRKHIDKRCAGCEHREPGVGCCLPSLTTPLCKLMKHGESGIFPRLPRSGFVWNRYDGGVGYVSIYAVESCPIGRKED